MNNNNRNRNKQKVKKEDSDSAQEEFSLLQNMKNKKHILSKSDIEKLNISLTPKQKDLFKSIKNNTLTIVQGPSGSSKTYTTCYTALTLLAEREIDRIIITKPIVDAGESYGYLPGLLEDKLSPYMNSYKATFEKILGKFLSDALFHNGVIEMGLLAYMRGNSYDRSLMILDESQNLEMSQAILWITRIGNGSKAVMMGDVSQYDIKKKDAKFLTFIDMCKDMSGVSSFKFERSDIVRNPFLIELTDRYEKWKYSESNIKDENSRK
jgi:phosphate starvation-inducible PhoH-like protein